MKFHPSFESFDFGTSLRLAGVGLLVALTTTLPLAADSRPRGGGQSESSAGEAPRGPAVESRGDRGSWNSGGGSSGGGTSVDRSPAPSSPSSPSSPPSSSSGYPGGGRNEWRERGSGSSSHSHGSHGGNGGYHHSPYSNGHSYWGYYGPWSRYWWTWGWDWAWGAPYGGYGGYGGYRGRDYGYDEEQGALDLDVSPDDTQVYVDGQLIGTVDDFDGFPQYLWLEKGTYDVVLYREGYKTLARQYSIYSGLVVDVNDRLERGDSIRPEDLETKVHDRRDARIEDERERSRRVEERERRRSRERDDDSVEETTPSRREVQADTGRLRIEVEPEDASVYVDGRFVGTGEELKGLRRGLLVDAGAHRISVVRPGHKAFDSDVVIDEGEQELLEIRLDREPN